MADRLNLSRDQLATFLKDPEQIKQFERLFGTVNLSATQLLTLDSVSEQAGGADSKANQALAYEAWPVGAIFISVNQTNPALLLGYGSWSQFGAGKVMVGLDTLDTAFDTPEETGGALTVQTTGTITGTAVANHASHTHTYSDVINHTHPHEMQGDITPSLTGTNVLGSDLAGGASRAMATVTGNPSGGVATGTTNGPSAVLTHSVTNGTFTGNATSVVQPYIVVVFWQRTA